MPIGPPPPGPRAAAPIPGRQVGVGSRSRSGRPRSTRPGPWRRCGGSWLWHAPPSAPTRRTPGIGTPPRVPASACGPIPFSEPYRDFLSRGTRHAYRNLGRHGYTPETVSPESFEIYDRLGNRLVRGYPLLTWRETRSANLGLQQSAVPDEPVLRPVLQRAHHLAGPLQGLEPVGDDGPGSADAVDAVDPEDAPVAGRAGRRPLRPAGVHGPVVAGRARSISRRSTTAATTARSLHMAGRYYRDLSAVASVGANALQPAPGRRQLEARQLLQRPAIRTRWRPRTRSPCGSRATLRRPVTRPVSPTSTSRL